MEKDAVISKIEAVEARVENLLSYCKELEQERDLLREELAAKKLQLEELELKELERMQEEENVQEKIDSLLERLDKY